MRRILLCSLVCLLLVTSADALPKAYKFTNLGSLGFGGTRPNALNESGQVVGRSGGKPFIWDRQNGIRAIPGIDFGFAYDINERGQVAGYADEYMADRPFLWDPVSGLHLLPVTDWCDGAVAYGINDAGMVTGEIYAQQPYCDDMRAAIWSPDGSIRYAGSLWSGYRINNSGLVVGAMQGPYDGASSCGPTMAAMCDPISGVIPIGAAPEWDEYQSFADDISDSGAVAGSSETYWGTGAFLWTMENGHRELLPDAEWSTYAFGINNRSQIVGRFRSYWWAPGEPFIWDPEEGFFLLGELIDPMPYSLTNAIDINDKGWIIAEGFDEHTGDWTGYLLQPAVVEVGVDIMPGNRKNPIYPGSSGVTSVAILGSAEIDASQVDPSTVTLAGAHVSARYRPSLRNVNGDRYRDIVLQVITREMRIGKGMTSAVLKGELLDGTPITGADKILVTAGPR